ncbi:exosortase [Sphingobium phenoxybenzoativorans]|uniref:Exosortase n=1 Tax=Sphingobium phenoxybenzoativorans TaxID=1592790 RepID=A0A975Q1B8_9SPHN|nr:exosortase [Sphingobium phenoxybenzoativorans]QUT05649.1 exosortase [Sphingobium phenoxybenzoativorans]
MGSRNLFGKQYEGGIISVVRNYWFLIAAVCLFTLPAIYSMAYGTWLRDQSIQTPFILASAFWLIARDAKGLTRSNPRVTTFLMILTPSLVAYVFSMVTGLIWLTWLATYTALIAVVYGYVGASPLQRLWFPLSYLIFVIPPPDVVTSPLTQSLKLWIASATLTSLSLSGFEVAGSGTMLYIDQYEVQLADACAGLNSLFSLLAIGSFYIYAAHRADWRYCALLALLIIPIAIGANMVRVAILLLLTHYFGDGVAQGPAHEIAGLTMFVAAFIAMIGVDALLTPFRRALRS